MSLLLSSRLPAHASTSAGLRNLHIALSDSGPRMSGVPVGRLMNGEPFFFDEFEAFKRGLISGTGKLVIGKVGFRKSTGVKTDISRKRFLKRGDRNRRSFVLDYKGEYDMLAKSFGVEPTSFTTQNIGQRLKLNVLDDELLTRAQQQILVEAIYMSASKANLGPLQQNALSIAIQHAHEGRDLTTVPDLIRSLSNPTAEMAKRVYMTVDQAKHNGSILAAQLVQLTQRDLAGVFEGPTSEEIKFKNNFTAFNFRGTSELAKPILISCMTALMEAAWERGDNMHAVDDVIYEEAWEYFRFLNFVRTARRDQKLHRNTGVNYTYIMHRLSDLSSAGDDGSETVKLARGLLADTSIRVIYHVDENEVDEVQSLCGLTDNEAYQIKNFKPGKALWKFGEFSVVVDHILAKGFETEMVDTDSSMHRNPVTDKLPPETSR